MMEMRALGRSGIEIPPLMFGGNVFGWTADQTMSFRLLDRLREARLSAIDTADVYSNWVPGHKGGESETMIGNWLAQRGGRDKVMIATKVGMAKGADGKKLSKAAIAQAAEDSLRRLQTDYIDLYQAHADDAETPLEETLEAFGALIAQGKVRAIGASNYSAPRLKQALETSARLRLPRYETLQPHYNLVERAGFEEALEPLCLSEQIGVISYYSLAAGFLTGKYRSETDLSSSPRGAGVKQYLNPQGMKLLQALDEVAAQHRATPAQVAIAWLIARPSVTAPIASATSIAQLDDLVKAVQLKLTPEAVRMLDQITSVA